MEQFIKPKIGTPQQYLISTVAVLLVALCGYVVTPLMGYQAVALLLLVTVSFIAMFFDIQPVIAAALISALVWDFFFIPPRFTFSISNPEDALLLSLYFVIAMVNGVLTHKIRRMEKLAGKRGVKEHTLRLYNTLLNSLSHELRTPIATIIGATDNLQADDNMLSENDKKQLLEEISKAGLRLNRQVENLLNMSRLESGEMNIKKDWCDINELVHAVLNNLQEPLRQQHLEVHMPSDLPLYKLDIGLMDQVLSNLILNAAIHNTRPCTIAVSAFAKNDTLVLVVEDNGVGFPPDEISKVFEKFYRLQGSQTGGTGLGLSIAKGFVEAHNGTIKLENKENGGARFTIEIPTEVSYLNRLKNE